MSDLVCKRCGGDSYRKSGRVRGLQRYECRGCGCNFTDTPPRGKSNEMRTAAVKLYARGGMSLRGIGEHFGISNVTVLRWIRKVAQALPEPAIEPGKAVLAVDEMWHFVQKKPAKSGCGGPATP